MYRGHVFTAHTHSMCHTFVVVVMMVMIQVYPHQRQVLQGLATALDDHKRLVRRAAVDARAKWQVALHAGFLSL